MTNFKLLLDDFEENDYILLAIHSVLEDYRLAFFLNKELPIVLSKSNEKIVLKNKKGTVVCHKYVFEDSFSEVKWTLIQNLNEITIAAINIGANLFNEEFVESEIKIYLLPEFKNVDFFLKIDHSENDLDTIEIINKISSIHNLSTVYEVKIDNLKTKNNLIF